MAKKRRVLGWHSMRKEQLVRAILRTAHSKSPKAAASSGKKPQRRASGNKNIGNKTTISSKKARTATTTKSRNVAAKATVHKMAAKAPAKSKIKAKPRKDPRILRRIEKVKAELERARNLAAEAHDRAANGEIKDRLVAMVRDSYWLQIYWELTRASVERARAALGQHWHTAKPVLRLLEISDGGTTGGISERLLRTIEVHGGVNNWYIDVVDPPCSYQLEIGYLSGSVGSDSVDSDSAGLDSAEQFYSLGRSNIVTTPRPSSRGALDQNWAGVAEDFDKIFSLSGGYSSQGDATELRKLFEERLRRPMGSPMVTRFGGGAQNLVPRDDEFEFEVDAEMIIYGTTSPDAHVTLKGEPVRIREDGSFTVRMSMPNSRQVIPAVASSCDGVEQRTIILSIDRNTKFMEPVSRDSIR